MMKGLVLDENMSNLTSASGEISASSGGRPETASLYQQQQQQQQQQQSFASTNPPPPKKKRSLPGNPDPDADVIALSPTSLLATNRFICEICGKGFQRDQNLQLHRRGHNLPWKLKQRTNKEVIKKKVYVCPEPSCVHHDPSRALGDLTGIKKHFCRKHGEKKWKCEKCSKRYAVQSDWKAHSKICGTREYRCDCGTLFSRRDSFITHRAFCDALAEENARAITGAAANHSLLSSSSSSHHMIHLQQALSSSTPVKREQQLYESHHLLNNNPRPDNNNNIPTWLAVAEAAAAAGPVPRPPAHLFQPSLDQTFLQQPDHHHHHQNPSPNPNPPPSLPPFQSPLPSAHMSATALLQKAAQMGVTMSSSSSSHKQPNSLAWPNQTHMSELNSSTAAAAAAAGFSSTSAAAGLSSREEMLASFGNKAAVTTLEGAGPNTYSSLVHDMMSSFDEEDFNGMLNPKRDNNKNNHSNNFRQENFSPSSKSSTHHHRQPQFRGSTTTPIQNREGLTRDFLGLEAFPRKDFLNVAGLPHLTSSSSSSSSSSAFGQQFAPNQTHWQS